MGTPVKIWVSEWSREWTCCLTEVTPRALQGWDNTAEGAAARWVTQGPGFLAPHLCPGRTGQQRTCSKQRLEEGWRPASGVECCLTARAKGPQALSGRRKAHAPFFSKETLFFCIAFRFTEKLQVTRGVAVDPSPRSPVLTALLGARTTRSRPWHRPHVGFTENRTFRYVHSAAVSSRL